MAWTVSGSHNPTHSECPRQVSGREASVLSFVTFKLLSGPGTLFKEPSLSCPRPAAARGSTPDHGRLGLPCFLTLTSSCDLDFICDSDLYLIP